MTEPINIPIEMGIKSKMNLTLTNTKTGEVQTMSMGAPQGMILNHYLDWAMERGLGLLGPATFNRCYLGTGDTPVQPTDTGLSGSQLAMSSSGVTTKGLADIGLKDTTLKEVKGIPIGSHRCLAITPDDSILVVASDSGLKAFSIDLDSYTLDELYIPDFDALSGLSCRSLCIEGDYLFVGLDQSPWGKVYKRSGNIYNFLSDVGQMSRYPYSSAFSPDGNYLVLSELGTRINSAVLYLWKIENDVVTYITKRTYRTHICTDLGFIQNYIYAVGYNIPSTGSNYRGYIALYSIEDLSEIESYYDVTVVLQFYNAVTIDENRLMVGGNPSYIFDINDLRNPVSVTGGIDSADILYNIKPGVVLKGGAKLSVFNVNPHISHNSGRVSTSNVVLSNTKPGVFLRGVDGSIFIHELRETPLDLFSYARKWTFPAGTGTGVVNEVVVQATSGTGSDGNNRYFLRFVLPEGFEKTDLHQLEVEVEAEIENPGVWEGVIPGGSRDESDVSYRITMSENQFRDFITTGYNNLASWFGTSGTPNVRMGTSNEDTDLVLDRENIRGEEIEYISSTAIREAQPYTQGSLERTIRLFLEVTQGNGKIGEIVFGDRFCRVTFDPPLNKYDPEGVDAGRDPSTRLYMNLVFGWKREGE